MKTVITASLIILLSAAMPAAFAHGGGERGGGGGGGFAGGGGGGFRAAAPAAAPMRTFAPAMQAAPTRTFEGAPMRSYAPAAPMRTFAPERAYQAPARSFSEPRSTYREAPTRAVRQSAVRETRQFRAAAGPSGVAHAAVARGSRGIEQKSNIGNVTSRRGNVRQVAAGHTAHATTTSHAAHTAAIAHAGRTTATAHTARTEAVHAGNELYAGAHGKSQNIAKQSAQRGASNQLRATNTAHGGAQTANGKQIAAATPSGRQAVGRVGSFANPRNVSPNAVRSNTKQVVSATPHALAWKAGANIPRAGKPGVGRPGIMDPGGYIRSANRPSSLLTKNYMQNQLSSIPNYPNTFAFNNRYRTTNTSQWPGQWHPGSGWNNIGYYNNYWWGNHTYPFSYYSPWGYTPTPYVFYPGYGQFWEPGYGYFNYLPYGYNAPISVAIQEVVPIYNAFGNIISYQPEMFNYNAFWDPSVGAYGYYDYRGIFHWLTFPWLNTWMGVA